MSFCIGAVFYWEKYGEYISDELIVQLIPTAI